MTKPIEHYLQYTTPVNDCLEWTRCFNTDGYPRAVHNGSSNGKVHRIVFSLANPDVDIEGLLVRHTCDNPRCINPSHLLAGTAADNMNDRDVRERHGLTRLSAKQVKVLRSLYATGQFKQIELADIFKINYRTVGYIVRNKSYRWVQ